MATEGTRPDYSSVRLQEVVGVLGEYRECFNRSDYFEAHEVLEELWLPVRRTEEGELWKGFIQLAAAFVHVQRARRGPALSLLRAARQRMVSTTVDSTRVNLPAAIQLAEEWETRVRCATESELPSLLQQTPPQLLAG
jgi:hypothetical protein